jgi:ABC-2 type transport system permease protein
VAIIDNKVLMFKKTFFELFSKRNIIIYLAVSLFVPLFTAFVSFRSSIVGLESEFEQTIIQMLFFSYLWTVGLPFLLFVSLTAAGSVSKESEKGTLLMLVTKPVRRSDIIIGKMVAFLLFFLILSSFIIPATVSIYTLLIGVSNFTFLNYMSLVLPLIMYSSILIVFFSALATFMSCLTMNTMRGMVVIIVLVVFILFGSDYVRVGTGEYYEGAGIYNADLKYHLGKTFYNFVGFNSPKIVKQWFASSFSILHSSQNMDQDQAMYMGATYTMKHYPPFVSIIILLALSAVMFFISLRLFDKKEIYGITAT